MLKLESETKCCTHQSTLKVASNAPKNFIPKQDQTAESSNKHKHSVIRMKPHTAKYINLKRSSSVQIRNSYI